MSTCSTEEHESYLVLNVKDNNWAQSVVFLSQCSVFLLLSHTTLTLFIGPMHPAKELHFIASLESTCGLMDKQRLMRWKWVMGLPRIRLKKRENVHFWSSPFLLLQSNLGPWNNFKDGRTRAGMSLSPTCNERVAILALDCLPLHLFCEIEK